MMKTGSLLFMAALHFVAMYFLMYLMVDRLDYVYPNLNNIYMAAAMTTPMLLIEAWLMGSMYNKNAIRIIAVASLLIFALSVYFIRKQTWITDREFVRSMIPHHSGAILMCREAKLQNRELQDLCRSIIRSQQSEIDRMEEILNK